MLHPHLFYLVKWLGEYLGTLQYVKFLRRPHDLIFQ